MDLREEGDNLAFIKEDDKRLQCHEGNMLNTDMPYEE
jgi:hypothetical protein